MRIVHVSPSLEVAGAERIVVDLARHSASTGDELVVVAPPGPLRDELVPFGIACHEISARGRSVLGAAAAALELARLIRMFRPDVIHSHNPRMTAIAAAARRCCFGRRPPLVASFHGGDVADDPLAARLLRLADRVVCVEDELRTRLLTHDCPAARARVIVNCVGPALRADDPLLAALEAELGPSAAFVAIVGSLTENKSVDRFIAAAALVCATVPDVQFLVVGDGPSREQLEALAASLECGARIRFLGVRRDATAIIQLATAVVSTSRGEGLSLTALESLTAGTPLIAPAVGGMRRLLRSGAGVLLADTQPATVAAAVLDVITSPERRERMGREGRALVATEYVQRHMFEAYTAVYADVLRTRR